MIYQFGSFKYVPGGLNWPDLFCFIRDLPQKMCGHASCFSHDIQNLGFSIFLLIYVLVYPLKKLCPL